MPERPRRRVRAEAVRHSVDAVLVRLRNEPKTPVHDMSKRLVINPDAMLRGQRFNRLRRLHATQARVEEPQLPRRPARTAARPNLLRDLIAVNHLRRRRMLDGHVMQPPDAPAVFLQLLRHASSLAAVGTLLFGLIWDEE